MIPEVLIGGLLIVGGAIWRLAFPGTYQVLNVQFWQWLTYSGAAYLAIGLVRDLYLKYAKKPTCPPVRAGEPTICLESTVGPIIVGMGIAVLAVGVRHVFHTPLPAIVIGLGVLFVLSGVSKDIVIVFRRDPNHISLIPW